MSSHSSGLQHSEEVYYQFFRGLEAKLEYEFKSMNKWSYRLINDYTLRGEPTLSVEVELRCGLLIRIICDNEFPVKAPRVICLNNYTHPLILTPRNDINYMHICPWLADMKIIKVPWELDNYFKDVPPIRQIKYDDIYARFREIEELVCSAPVNMPGGKGKEASVQSQGMFGGFSSRFLSSREPSESIMIQGKEIDSKMLDLATVLGQLAGNIKRKIRCRKEPKLRAVGGLVLPQARIRRGANRLPGKNGSVAARLRVT
jgi:hypothetical protein